MIASYEFIGVGTVAEIDPGIIDVLVVGGVAFDYVGCASELPGPGTSVVGDGFVVGPGGKGANGAVGAARLGARTALVGRIGQDEAGDRLERILQAEGVDLRCLVRDDEAPTAATVIQVGGRGQKQTLSRPGSNHRLCIADVRRARALFEVARVLLVQLEVPLSAVIEAVEQARRSGLRVVLDPAPAHSLPDTLLRGIDVITLNAKEAETLTGVRVTGREHAQEAAVRLLQRGVGAVAVEAGDEGKLLAWPGGSILLPRLPVEPVDTTGAGDAFAAGLAVGLAEGASLQEAARRANVCAGLAIAALGAQAALPTREAVAQVLSQMKDYTSR